MLETSNRTWAARPVGAGAAISNRITLTTDWTRGSSNLAANTDFDSYRWPRMPTAIADDRLAHTRATVARGGATTAGDLACALRDHGRDRSPEELPDEIGADGAGFSVCMHRRESHSQTTASMIAELRTSAPPRAWMSLGNPCTSVYVPCFPPAVAPELADAEHWRRFARLRDRVEARRSASPRSEAVLAVVEAELWTQAEAVFVSGERSRSMRSHAPRSRPVDAALHRLGV